jgi:zinc D-Ala-D-Ala dipeptidase
MGSVINWYFVGIFMKNLLKLTFLAGSFGFYGGTPLVDLASVDSSVQVDMRYSTSNNFAGRVLVGYEANRCFLLSVTAQNLHRVQEGLKESGLGLKVYDCYRPVSASVDMVKWTDETNNGHLLGEYIASRSGHNRGNVVDLTLVSLKTGRELDMGLYDEFSEASWTRNGASSGQKENRLLLKAAMEKGGFKNYSKEWWHYSCGTASERFDVPIQVD